MLRIRRALLTASLAALALAAPAKAAPPPLGGLTPFPGAAGCFDGDGTGGCTAYAPQVDGVDLAQTASVVYASAGGALMAYRRGADGGLTPFDCVASSMVAACAGTDALVVNAARIAVSAATRTLYATTGSTAASSRILAFRLEADGGIGARIGCLAEQSTSGCIDVTALDQPVDVALSADGRRLYTASKGPDGGIAAFDAAADGTFPIAPQLAGCLGAQGGAGCASGERDLTGASAVAVRGTRLYAAWRGGSQNNSGVEVVALGADGSPGARLACVAENSSVEAACATEWPSLTYPQALLVAPDRASLAVGGGAGAVTTFALDADGAIGTRLSCETAAATAGCTTRTGLGPVEDLALSPDGLTLHAAAHSAGAWAFDRAPATGATAGAATCVAAALAGCAPFAGVGDAFGVLVAPDGARAYVNSRATGGLAVFQREVGPSCLPTSAAVAPPAASAALTLSCSDANGDPITYELASAPAHGTATVAPGGAAAYTPAAGFTGTDVFAFRATDGTVASAAANVVVAVVPAAAPAPPPTAPSPVALASTIDRIRSPVRSRDLVRFTGRAAGDGLTRVEISVVRLDHGARAAARRKRAACRRLRASGLLARPVRAVRPCRPAGFLTASGTARWTFNLLRALPRGRYVVVSRAVGRSGTERSASATRRNRRAFTVR